jgi:acid phosphatase type 7
VIFLTDPKVCLGTISAARQQRSVAQNQRAMGPMVERKELVVKKIGIPVACLLSAMWILASSPVPQNGSSGATAIPDHITLTWTGDPATTVTITWRTDETVTSGFVQYQKGVKVTEKASQVKAQSRNFVTDIGVSRLFSTTLTNLSPKTRFSYRVGDGTNWSDSLSFATADPKARAFKFLIFGDSQDMLTSTPPYARWHQTAQNAYMANPDARFMVNVGDLVDIGQSGAHWNAWFAAAKGIVDRIPAMAVIGNHDFFTQRGIALPEYWMAQFSLPKNGPEGLKNRVYSYDYGPAHFVVLDSQQDEQRKSGDILGIQKEWLDKDLAESKATWKIVFFHRPPYGLMEKRTNDNIKAAFCPILEKHGVDLVFTAHDHGVGRTFPIKDGVYMSRPSQGTIYYVSGRSGGKTYTPLLAKKDWNTFFYDPDRQPNYFVVGVENKKITINTVLLDGTLINAFFIDKAKDVSSDTPLYPKTKAANWMERDEVISPRQKRAA